MENGLHHDQSRCFVSSKLHQSSPQQTTRIIRVQSLPVQWTELDPCMGDSGFLSFLLEDDLDRHAARRLNWRAICGIGLSLAMGAGIWAGLGLLISRMT